MFELVDNIIVVDMDGTDFCAHFVNFINMQESPCGFGNTPLEAVKNFIRDLEE